jgi:hypothetical protein
LVTLARDGMTEMTEADFREVDERRQPEVANGEKSTVPSHHLADSNCCTTKNSLD